MAAGKTYDNCSSVRKACDFLLSKQLKSGGWGESYLSCQNKVYIFYIHNFAFFPTLEKKKTIRNAQRDNLLLKDYIVRQCLCQSRVSNI